MENFPAIPQTSVATFSFLKQAHRKPRGEQTFGRRNYNGESARRLGRQTAATVIYMVDCSGSNDSILASVAQLDIINDQLMASSTFDHGHTNSRPSRRWNIQLPSLMKPEYRSSLPASISNAVIRMHSQYTNVHRITLRIFFTDLKSKMSATNIKKQHKIDNRLYYDFQVGFFSSSTLVKVKFDRY
jgi:hypothetical protein